MKSFYRLKQTTSLLHSFSYLKMKFAFVIGVVSLFFLALAEASDDEIVVRSNPCGCFCFNMGPFYRRTNRAKRVCEMKPGCAVMDCRRNGRRGKRCCNASPSPTPSATPSVSVSPSSSPSVSVSPSVSPNPTCACKCRRGPRGRTLARMDCRGIRAFCKVSRCGRSKGLPKFQCCDRE